MMLKPSTILSTTLLVLTTFSFGCQKEVQGSDSDPIPDSPVLDEPIVAAKDEARIEITVQVGDNDLALAITNIPDGSELECHLNDLAIDACHDGAVLALPLPGTYRISGIAIKDGKTVGIAESEEFEVETKSVNIVDGAESLQLINKTPDWEDGSGFTKTKDLTLSFDFKNAPECTARFQCQYDSRFNPFWVDCDQNDKTFTIPKDLLADGLQYASMRAVCGDTVGPELSLSWYIVPDDYQPLMLQETRDGNGRHIVSLAKENDCAIEDQVFECAKPDSEAYDRCDGGNLIENPAPGTRIRLQCNDKTGPDLILQ